MGCCKYFCGITALVLALFFSPLLMYGWQEVLLDDVATWGLKGPGLSTLTPNMKGVYYLSGNQTPKKCTDEEKKDPQTCRGNWHRSPGMALDMSYCSYDAMSKVVTCPSTSPWMLAGGPKALKIFPIVLLMRVAYVINKGDPEFAGRPEPSFDGAMKLYMMGMPATLLNGWNYSYRITMKDSGDGSSVTRYTWWNASNTPQPIKDADPEWTYDMKRIYDGKTVDKAVLAEVKKMWGDSIVIGVPKYTVGAALAGLVNLFTMDLRFMPM